MAVHGSNIFIKHNYKFYLDFINYNIQELLPFTLHLHYC